MPYDRATDADGQVPKGLGREGEVDGVGEVGGELAWEFGIEVVPDVACPAPTERPLGERFVHDHLPVALSCNDLCRLDGSVEWRAHDGGARRQPDGCICNLAATVRRQQESWEVGVDDVTRIRDLSVAYQEDAAGRRVHLRQATGYGEPMAPFAEPILHVDMDSFFVEVERLTDPNLVGIPVAVGGIGPRGVVASASYEARSHGVTSAMPVGEARRRCPSLTIVSPEHGRYGEISGDVFDVMRSVTPLVEGISIDEAFLDVSGLRLHYPSAEAVGAHIRSLIRAEVGIPSSVGIATTKFVAKLASKHAKPDGMLRIEAGTELAFLHPLDVSELWGVGEATKANLGDLGIRTIGDVASAPIGLLEGRIGSASAHHLSELSTGHDPRPVEDGMGARSISSENTFSRDLIDPDAIERETLRLCDQVAARLAKAHLSGHTISLKVRFGDFATISRSSRQAVPISHTSDVWEIVRDLLGRAEMGDRSVRLLGVAVSDLADTGDSRQLTLGAERRDAAGEAVDEVRERFGAASVIPARIAPRKPNPADPGSGGG